MGLSWAAVIRKLPKEWVLPSEVVRRRAGDGTGRQVLNEIVILRRQRRREVGIAVGTITTATTQRIVGDQRIADVDRSEEGRDTTPAPARIRPRAVVADCAKCQGQAVGGRDDPTSVGSRCVCARTTLVTTARCSAITADRGGVDGHGTIVTDTGTIPSIPTGVIATPGTTTIAAVAAPAGHVTDDRASIDLDGTGGIDTTAFAALTARRITRIVFFDNIAGNAAPLSALPTDIVGNRGIRKGKR